MDKNKTLREQVQNLLIPKFTINEVYDFIQSKIQEAEERGYLRGRQDEAYLNSGADQ